MSSSRTARRPAAPASTASRGVHDHADGIHACADPADCPPIRPPADFPFDVRLSFAPAAAWLRSTRAGLGAESPLGLALDNLVARLDALADPATLDRLVADPAAESCLLSELQTLLLGTLGAEHSPSALMLPFVKRMLHASPRFERLKSGAIWHKDGGLRAGLEGMRGFEDLMALQAYTVILERLYGFRLPLGAGMVISTVDPDDGIEKQFRLELDFRFCEIGTCSHCAGLPAIEGDDRCRLLEELTDIATLTRLLPPDSFHFEGFIIARLVEVSREHALTDLQAALSAVDALTETAKLGVVQERLRRLLGKPDLHLMLVAVRGDIVYQLHPDAELCEFQGFRRSCMDEFNGSIFRAVHDSRQPKVVADLARLDKPGGPERELIEQGIRSLLYIPLVVDSIVVGGLLLQSENTGAFSPVDVINLAEILPAVGIALSRGMDNFDARVRDLIQERFTAIHPAVEWKFERAAIDRLMDRSPDAALRAETPILFDKVWPLYSVSDIRGSSHFRNEAIRADLLRQIGLARVAVEAARSGRPMPYLDELLYRLDAQAARLADSLSSGDEIELLHFLADEVEPAMEGLAAFGPAAAEARAAYAAAIHAEHRSVYDKRKDFDESVSRINRGISVFVDRLQPEAQAMFPHYFDKNSTDGVDMNMYIGPSLVSDGRWQALYLKNLRLWQFIVMCRVAHLAWRMRETLPLPLSVTHLIVVQDMPISIRFNQDEKRFAVDGAYNIRYEIMKKRIDKAVVKGTGERLTQPDRVAIVYSQHSEAQEYSRYIQYLQARGYLEDEVERLDLDDLQGISGLKALRVAVRMRGDGSMPSGLERDFPADEGSIIELIAREFGADIAAAAD